MWIRTAFGDNMEMMEMAYTRPNDGLEKDRRKDGPESKWKGVHGSGSRMKTGEMFMTRSGPERNRRRWQLKLRRKHRVCDVCLEME